MAKINIAFASGGELETQIEIAKSISSMAKLNYSRAEALLGEVMKILNKMTSSQRPASSA